MFTYESVNPGDGNSINISYNDCTLLRDCDKLKSGTKLAVIAVSYTLFGWNNHSVDQAQFSNVVAPNIADYSISSINSTSERVERNEIVKIIKNADNRAENTTTALAHKKRTAKAAAAKKSVKKAIKKPKKRAVKKNKGATATKKRKQGGKTVNGKK